MTLTEFCGECRNYFICGAEDIHSGEYEIVGGYIQPLDFLQDGQYFRIVGSVFNDGVWRYPSDILRDEKFTGTVWAMSVPPDAEKLARDIDEWCEKHANALDGVYSSESFNNYSYSLPTSSTGGGYGWRDKFSAALNKYRKLREI